ncbi:MAG: hypothetical protein K2V38_21785 [Gemmataceae bacterium]|nr:hypothetical protein [Gemmataceae bacterium]
MPWFALDPDPIEYQPAAGPVLLAVRPVLRVEIGYAGWVRPYAFFDTGAPFSVISQAAALNIGASLRPITLPDPIPATRGGLPVAPVPAAQLRAWWDPIAGVPIPCLLAEITVRLRDRDTGRTSDPLRMVTKVLQAPAQPFNGLFVLLGNHLLVANDGQLHLEGQSWGLGGPGLFFPP